MSSERSRKDRFTHYLVCAQASFCQIEGYKNIENTRYLNAIRALRIDILSALDSERNDELYTKLDQQAELVLLQNSLFDRICNLFEGTNHNLLKMKYDYNNVEKLEEKEEKGSCHSVRNIDILFSEKFVSYIKKNIIDKGIDDYDIKFAQSLLYAADNNLLYAPGNYPAIIKVIY